MTDIESVQPGRLPTPRRLILKAAPVRFLVGLIITMLVVTFAVSGTVTQLISRPNSLLPDAHIASDGPKVEGVVDDVTLESRGRSRSGDRYRIDFSYTTQVGESLQGYSYTKRPHQKPGMAATIEYNLARPEVSRVRGTTAAAVHMGLFVAMAGPLLIGILFLLAAREKLLLFRRLYSDGERVAGKIAKVNVRSGIRVNQVSPWRIEFQFHDRMGVLHLGVTSFMPDKKTAKESPAEVGGPCVVLFDPDRPQNNCVMIEERPRTRS